MKIVTSSHDLFFKRSMTNIEVAREFFTQHLPVFMLEKANLDSLRLQTQSFVDADLDYSLIDILYTVEFKEGRLGYFYILTEHQRNPDRLMPFRLNFYVFKIMSELHIGTTPGIYSHLDRVSSFHIFRPLNTRGISFAFQFFKKRDRIGWQATILICIGTPTKLVRE